MGKQAFTLIELMVVVSIIVMLAAFGGLAVRNLGSGARLTTDSAKLMGWIQLARDQAITSQHPTALVLLTSPATSDAAWRALTILEYQPPPAAALAADSAGTWTQISRWNLLSAGVLIDHDTTDSNDQPLNVWQTNASPLVDTLDGSAGRGDLRYLREKLNPRADYQYIVFLGNGAIYRDHDGVPEPPYRIRLVEGILRGNDIQYTNRKDGQPANFCEILLNGQTGQMQLIRPERAP
ncbi:MAG: prepilin-type N-terminal cleavage/methylation domain-containing protein [Verrucomicrobiales bacterium]|jgi:prepilin-type N-terminal cleavage/methylation domain-containing protein|nr:prepilin-type N-terminal cleavage/methylation domain-containing protein [Verrucomicrobiales bacterium]